MSKQTLAVAAGAVLLFLVAVFGVMALTGGGGSGSTPPAMTMPDGSTMPAGQMSSSNGTDNGQAGQTGMDSGMTGMDMSTTP